MLAWGDFLRLALPCAICIALHLFRVASHAVLRCAVNSIALPRYCLLA